MAGTGVRRLLTACSFAPFKILCPLQILHHQKIIKFKLKV